MWTNPTGATQMFSYIAKRNIESMLKGNIIAIVLIALIMMFALNSIKLGALSIIPNAIPVLVTFGIWALSVGIIGMAAATITATSLGIIVDDTVHLLTKYLRGRREQNLTNEDAIRYSFRTVGKAVTINTVILTAGFSILALSSFKVNEESGILTAIAVLSALVLDFLLLPALLLLIYKNKTAPATLPGASHA
jgi:predicted RND superfamily exporter protein